MLDRYIRLPRLTTLLVPLESCTGMKGYSERNDTKYILTLQPPMVLPQAQPRIGFDEYLDDEISILMSASYSLQKSSRSQANQGRYKSVVPSYLSASCLPSLVNNIRS